MATYYDSGLVSERRSNRVQDWINVVLAIWLFISPWVLAFGAGGEVNGTAGGWAGSAGVASWNAWVMGVLVFLVAMAAVSRTEMWQEWLNLLFGIWIFVAPWVLGFVQLGSASWDHWLVGAAIFLVALWGVGTMRSLPATRASINRPMPPTSTPPDEPLV